MPKLKKEILPEGEYLVATPSGKRQFKRFEPEYLSTVVVNTNKMIEAGLKVPAPYKHLKEAVPVSDELHENSYDNAGYWDKFDIVEKNGKKLITGVVDAPGETSNLSTPAGKLSNTIQEVSVCIKDSWTDGLGREWGPCILHCAPVLHPVVPGQDGFSLLEDAVALSVSGLAIEPSVTNLAELSKELEDSAGLYIPPDTMLEELPRVLLTVLKQKKLSDTSDSGEHEVVEVTGVFMSLPDGEKMPISKSNAEYLLSLGAINPKTQKPFTLEDFEIKTDPKDVYALAVTNELTEQRKSDLKRRVSTLVDTKRTTQEYAEKSLYPMIDTYELSLGEGAKFRPNTVDMLVENLENLPAPAGETSVQKGLPKGSDIHEFSTYSSGDSDEELSADDAEKLRKELLAEML